MTDEDLIEEFMCEIVDDYAPITAISHNVAWDSGAQDWRKTMEKSLQLIGKIIDKGGRPGNFEASNSFVYWSGTRNESLTRIELEWTALNRLPETDEICWFGLPEKMTGDVNILSTSAG